MCLCHVSILLSVFMRTLTGCRNVSLSCEHFTLCSCKHRQVAEMCHCCVSSLPSGLCIRTVTGCIAVSLSLCCLYYDPIMCACTSNLRTVHGLVMIVIYFILFFIVFYLVFDHVSSHSSVVQYCPLTIMA